MQVTIRVYRQHDMDLINLYRMDSFRFATEVKKALVAYANGDIYEPGIPEGEAPRPGYVPKFHQMHFTLNEKNPQHAKAIAILSSLKAGQRNAFIKALFRSCLPYLPLLSFQNGDGLILKKANEEDIDRLLRGKDVSYGQREIDPALRLHPAVKKGSTVENPGPDLGKGPTTESKATAPEVIHVDLSNDVSVDAGKEDADEDDMFAAMSSLSH